AVEEYIARALPHQGANRVAYLAFAVEPGLVGDQRSRSAIPDPQRRGTNIAAALEVASAAIPPSYVPHIVLLSDGNQTAGDALKTALRGGVLISTVPLPSKSEPEVQVASLNAPAQVREGEPFQVEVVLDSNCDDTGNIEIFRKGIKVSDDSKSRVTVK